MATDMKIVLPGSYQQYKTDTAAFLTWLLRTAKTCGYEFTTSSAQDETAQEASVLLKVAGRNMPVREVLVQARLIRASSSPLCKIPAGVVKLAERAISGRQTRTEHFKTMHPSAADGTHTFFTTTLRQALDMLEQRAEVKSVKRIITPQVSGVTPELHNLFSALEFEDCVNVEGSATQEHRPNKNKTLPLHIDDGMDVITAEDIFMRVDCFFDDLSNMQDHVIDLWKRYRHGDIDVVAAAMSTNAALTFAEQMETELLEFLEPNFPASQMTSTVPISGVLSTPGRFLQHIFTEPDYEWPLDPINACAVNNDGYFLDIIVILSKLTNALWRRELDFEAQGQLKKEERVHKWWPRVETLETIFITQSAVPELAMQVQGFDDMKAKDEFLTPMIIDTILRAEQLRAWKWPHRAALKDPFTRSLMQFTTGGAISTVAVLGCSIIYELQLLMGNSTAALFKTLQGLAHETAAQIDPAESHPFPPRWLKTDSEYVDAIARLHSLVTDYKDLWKDFKKDIVHQQPPKTFDFNDSDHEWRHRTTVCQPLDLIMDLIRHQDEATCPFFLPSTEPSRMWTANPLLCGTVLYSFELAKEQAGVSLSNTSLSVFMAAYLYGSLKADNQIHGTWPAMDKTMQVHIQTMFLGGLPKDPVKWQNAWDLKNGNRSKLEKKDKKYNIIGRGGARTGKRPLKEAQASCLSVSDTTEHVCQWLDGKETLIRSIHTIKDIMERNAAKATRLPEGTESKPFLFLRQFANHIGQDRESCNVDYLTLTRTCDALLKHIVDKKVFEHHVKQQGLGGSVHPYGRFRESYEPHKTLGAAAWFFIDSLLWSERILHEYRTGSRKDKQLAGNMVGSPMQLTGKFLQKYMKDQGLLVQTK